MLKILIRLVISATIVAVALPLSIHPSFAAEPTLSEILSGKTVPSTIAIKELTPEWRALRTTGQFDTGSIFQAQLMANNKIFVAGYYTKGQTISLAGESYIIAYSLQDKLEKIDKQSMTRRKERSRLVRVALVGYTNVGKSTLMQRLAKVEVFAENKLFATVDSTVRKMVLGNIPFLLTDTVGFIRKLPTMLVESFKSTLDEIREADILVHVVDISHPLVEEQIEVVNTTLGEIGAADKPIILVFNKLDLYKTEEIPENDWEITNPDGVPTMTMEENLEKLRKHYLGKNTEKVVFISAEKKENLEELREILVEMVRERHFKIYPNWSIEQNVNLDWQE